MRDLFPGFYSRTEKELSNLWQEGIFVFDTNMLLHVYEYSFATRERFFETLGQLRERIWIPYQVALEYQRRRMKVIMEQKNSYKAVSKHLDKTLQFLKEGLEPYKKDKHAFIDTEGFINKINQEIISSKAEIQKTGSKHPDYKATDPFREKLDELFTGRIGTPYDKETRKKKFEEAQYRLENQIPPGFEDSGKGSIDRYGDVIVWFQLIDYASSKKMPIIFITDDFKKDWWIPQEESFGARRPRPELAQELYLETGVLFHMYEGYDFMDEAQRFLKLEAKPEVIEEIKEIGEKNALELNQIKYRATTERNRAAYNAESAVQEWLQAISLQHDAANLQQDATNLQHDTIEKTYRRPDFVIVQLDGKKIGVEVKYIENPYSLKYSIKSILDRFNQDKQIFDDFIVIFVANTVFNAINIIEWLEQNDITQDKISFIVGHIGPDDQFLVVSGLPKGFTL